MGVIWQEWSLLVKRMRKSPLASQLQIKYLLVTLHLRQSLGDNGCSILQNLKLIDWRYWCLYLLLHKLLRKNLIRRRYLMIELHILVSLLWSSYIEKKLSALANFRLSSFSLFMVEGTDLSPLTELLFRLDLLKLIRGKNITSQGLVLYFKGW